MTRNMSTVDRAVRAFILAPAAIVVALVVGIGTVAGVVLLAAAGVMLATGAVGWCPLYALFHFDTCGRRVLPH